MMKKHTTTLVKTVILLFLALFLLWNCQQDEIANPEEKELNETNMYLVKGRSKEKINKAREWLNKNKPNTRNSNNSKLMWDYAFNEENVKEETVEIPLSFMKQNSVILPGCEKKFKETKDYRYLKNLVRLVVKEDSVTKENEAFYMVVAPSLSYLESNNFNLSASSYLTRDSLLDGIVLFYNLEEKFVNGWKYEKGKITKQILPQEKDTPKTRALWCQPVYTLCYTEWTFSNSDEVYYSDIKVEINWQCWATPSPVYHGGGGGGSGKGGGYTREKEVVLRGDSISLAPGLKELFQGKCTLTDEDIIKLNEEYERMKKKCFYNFIDNYIKEKKMKLKDIGYGNGGQASVSNLGNLRFAGNFDITAENISHEWIHLYQMQYHKLLNTDMKSKRGMMEFELAFIQDILALIENKGDDESIARFWAGQGKGEKYRKDYTDWLKEITRNGTQYPTSIEHLTFLNYSKRFGEGSISYNVEKGYIYGNATYRAYAAQALFRQAKEYCNK